jgi:hypothetical protein
MPSNIIENLYLKKPSFGPSKWPRKLKPAKNSKLPKLPESHFEPFGKGGWPSISTWINNLLTFNEQTLILLRAFVVNSAFTFLMALQSHHPCTSFRPYFYSTYPCSKNISLSIIFHSHLLGYYCSMCIIQPVWVSVLPGDGSHGNQSKLNLIRCVVTFLIYFIVETKVYTIITLHFIPPLSLFNIINI